MLLGYYRVLQPAVRECTCDATATLVLSKVVKKLSLFVSKNVVRVGGLIQTKTHFNSSKSTAKLPRFVVAKHIFVCKK